MLQKFDFFLFSNFQARHAVQQVPYRVFESLLNDQIGMQCSLLDVGTQTRVHQSLASIFEDVRGHAREFEKSKLEHQIFTSKN